MLITMSKVTIAMILTNRLPNTYFEYISSICFT